MLGRRARRGAAAEGPECPVHKGRWGGDGPESEEDRLRWCRSSEARARVAAAGRLLMEAWRGTEDFDILMAATRDDWKRHALDAADADELASAALDGAA